MLVLAMTAIRKIIPLVVAVVVVVVIVKREKQEETNEDERFAHVPMMMQNEGTLHHAINILKITTTIVDPNEDLRHEENKESENIPHRKILVTTDDILPKERRRRKRKPASRNAPGEMSMIHCKL